MESKVNKFDQIGRIFSQFSEENKEKLLDMAKSLLKVQQGGLASITASQNDVKAKGRCPEK